MSLLPESPNELGVVTFRTSLVPAWQALRQLVFAEYPEGLTLSHIVETWGPGEGLTPAQIEVVKLMDEVIERGGPEARSAVNPYLTAPPVRPSTQHRYPHPPHSSPPKTTHSARRA